MTARILWVFGVLGAVLVSFPGAATAQLPPVVPLPPAGECDPDTAEALRILLGDEVAAIVTGCAPPAPSDPEPAEPTPTTTTSTSPVTTTTPTTFAVGGGSAGAPYSPPPAAVPSAPAGSTVPPATTVPAAGASPSLAVAPQSLDEPRRWLGLLLLAGVAAAAFDRARLRTNATDGGLGRFRSDRPHPPIPL